MEGCGGRCDRMRVFVTDVERDVRMGGDDGDGGGGDGMEMMVIGWIYVIGGVLMLVIWWIYVYGGVWRGC